MHRIVLLVIYLIFVVSSALAICTGEKCLNCPPENQDPYIYEISSDDVNLFNQVNVTRGEIQYKNLGSVQFHCMAAYPVEWQFEGKDISSNLIVASRAYLDHILTPSKTCYEAMLWTANDPSSVTGNYTCRSVDGTKSFSFYRYSYDEEKSLFNTKKNTNAAIKMDKKTAEVIIPCSSHVANLNATLLKNGYPVTSDDKMEVAYDTKYGFIVNATLSPEELSGNYECQGEFGDRRDKVAITVPKPKDFEALPVESYLSFTSDKITLSCKSNERVEMSYKNKDSSIQHKSLSINYPGEYLQHGATIELKKKRTANSFRGHVKCVKRKSKEVLWTWNYDSDYSCQCTWPLVKNDCQDEQRFPSTIEYELPEFDDPQLMNLTCTTKAKSPLDFVFVHCSNPTHCNLIFDKSLKYNSQNYHDSGRSLKSGIIKCQVGKYTSRLMAIADLDKLNVDKEPVQNIASLMRIRGPKRAIDLGRKARFSCKRTTYHMSESLKWVLVYRNGTLEEVDVPLKDQSIVNNLGQRVTSVYLEIPNFQVKEVMCLAPEWNSSKWRNVTFPIELSGTIYGPAIFINNKNETT